MAELKLTPSRLDLLRAVNEHLVFRQRRATHLGIDFYRRRPGDTELRVTSRVNEAIAAGWLEQGPASGPSMYARRPVLLTERGRRILAAWPNGVAGRR